MQTLKVRSLPLRIGANVACEHGKPYGGSCAGLRDAERFYEYDSAALTAPLKLTVKFEE